MLCDDNMDLHMRRGVTEMTREARFILFHLHDRGSRQRLFPTVSAPPDVLEDLIRRFDANPVLVQSDEKQRRVALWGDRTPFIPDDELAEIGVNLNEFRTLYRLFFTLHS